MTQPASGHVAELNFSAGAALIIIIVTQPHLFSPVRARVIISIFDIVCWPDPRNNQVGKDLYPLIIRVFYLMISSLSHTKLLEKLNFNWSQDLLYWQ